MEETPPERDLEREEIEYVFGLTGNELTKSPWVVRDDEGSELIYKYTYEGVPDYAKGDHDDSSWGYKTVITDSEEPEWLIDAEGDLWHLEATHGNNGETECPEAMGDVPWVFGMEACPLCDAPPGDPHGMIYIGPGWGETVYRSYKSARALGEERGEETGRTVPDASDWRWLFERDELNRFGPELEKNVAAVIAFSEGMKKMGDDDCTCHAPNVGACYVHQRAQWLEEEEEE